jgi:hypothetical protein
MGDGRVPDSGTYGPEGDLLVGAYFLPIQALSRGGMSSRRKQMNKPAEIEIVRRAYQLWQQAGEPEGRDQEFYHQAEQELRNEDKASPLRTPDNL